MIIFETEANMPLTATNQGIVSSAKVSPFAAFSGFPLAVKTII